MTRCSSSVRDSSGAYIVVTGTWLHQTAFLTYLTRESEVNTLVDPFTLLLRFRGMLEVVESRQNEAEVL